jgi:hypothetical protein
MAGIQGGSWLQTVRSRCASAANDQPDVPRDLPRSAPVINTAAATEPPGITMNPRPERRDADRAARMRDFANRNRERRDRDLGDRDRRNAAAALWLGQPSISAVRLAASKPVP